MPAAAATASIQFRFASSKHGDGSSSSSSDPREARPFREDDLSCPPAWCRSGNKVSASLDPLPSPSPLLVPLRLVLALPPSFMGRAEKRDVRWR